MTRPTPVRSLMHEIRALVHGRRVRGLEGGHGEALLLLHGGWGGASMHWGTVADRLAQSFQVIAPDLPGLGTMDEPPLGSVAAYAMWLRTLLDSLGVERAWVVGNSFGASVACRFATNYPGRCAGLVIVNGFPMPKTPAPLLWAGRTARGHRLLARLVKRLSYQPSAIARAFVDVGKAPAELRALLAAKRSPLVEAFTDLLVEGDGVVSHDVAPLFLWGCKDRLPRTHAVDAWKMHASWPDSKLVFVPNAGHFPQLENPAAFVEALEAFTLE